MEVEDGKIVANQMKEAAAIARTKKEYVIEAERIIIIRKAGGTIVLSGEGMEVKMIKFIIKNRLEKLLQVTNFEVLEA